MKIKTRLFFFSLIILLSSKLVCMESKGIVITIEGPKPQDISTFMTGKGYGVKGSKALEDFSHTLSKKKNSGELFNALKQKLGKNNRNDEAQESIKLLMERYKKKEDKLKNIQLKKETKEDCIRILSIVNGMFATVSGSIILWHLLAFQAEFFLFLYGY